MAHTPGPWTLVEKATEMRIHPDWNGQPGAVALTIGSTAFSFRARRQGSRRGEKMVYRPFSEQDRADARLIAAAPDLLEACQQLVHAVDTQDGMAALDMARAAIAKAEGR